MSKSKSSLDGLSGNPEYEDYASDQDIEYDEYNIEFEDDSFSVPETVVDSMISEYYAENKANLDASTDLTQRHLTDAEKKFIGNSSQMTVNRIMKDRCEIAKNIIYNSFFEIDFVDDNIHVWNLLMRFPETEQIQKNLDDYAKETGKNHPNAVKIEITFPVDFPMSPPFMRVVSPRFKFRTGRITIGGSICTELLTSSGWVPTYSVGQALIQIQSEILEGNASFEPCGRDGQSNQYSDTEAREAFARKAREMGWAA